MVPVEPRQALRSAEPQEPARIRDDAVNAVRCQAVGGSVGPDRQQLAFQERGKSAQDNQNRSPFHAASGYAKILNLTPQGCARTYTNRSEEQTSELQSLSQL